MRRHGASARAEEGLARASEATHPRDAVTTYAKRVEQLATEGGNIGHENAAGLVARMAALRSPSEQAAYLTALKARHARKRNFMRLL